MVPREAVQSSVVVVVPPLVVAPAMAALIVASSPIMETSGGLRFSAARLVLPPLPPFPALRVLASPGDVVRRAPAPLGPLVPLVSLVLVLLVWAPLAAGFRCAGFLPSAAPPELCLVAPPELHMVGLPQYRLHSAPTPKTTLHHSY